jgi:hypothetical protein
MAKAPNPIFTQDTPQGLTKDQADYADAFNEVDPEMDSLDRACDLVDEVLKAVGSEGRVIH